jgi:putative phosphoribosyl transferase
MSDWRLDNRTAAGRLLAQQLQAYARHSDAIVLALPRGGVPVAYEIAMALGLPLDVVVVRKIGVPRHPELAMGAVAADGTYAISWDIIEECGIANAEFSAALDRELEEAQRRQLTYRDGRPAPQIQNKTAILVDDGLATGATMQVAIDAVRSLQAAKVLLALPVAPPGVKEQFAGSADDVVCLITPEPFMAVGFHYCDFAQVDDMQVCNLLAKAAARQFAA